MENQNWEILTLASLPVLPIITGCLHADANLVLEFVPDCKLINAKRR